MVTEQREGEYFCGKDYINPEIDCTTDKFCSAKCTNFQQGKYCSLTNDKAYCECNGENGGSFYKQCAENMIYDPKLGGCSDSALDDPTRDDACLYHVSVKTVDPDRNSIETETADNVAGWAKWI